MQLAAKIAENSPGVGRGKFRVGAVIFVRNELASFGFNQKKSNPFQAEYGRNRHAIFLHAETHAIRNALRTFSADEFCRQRTSMYVVRILKNRNWAMSRPCIGCMRAIVQYEIDDVYYSIDGTDEMNFRFASLQL